MPPKKTEWTVRVINYGEDDDRQAHNTFLRGLWVEQLRYMGMASELAAFEKPHRNVIEFRCPLQGHDTKIWAEQNAARMRSFGIDAAAAPAWRDDENRGGPGSWSRTEEETQAHMERHNKPKVGA